MALTREQKENLLERYQSGIATAPHAFLLGFKGLNVPEITELRSKVRETGGEYLVVKNRIALRAIEGAQIEGLKEMFSGPTAVVYANDDPVSLAKTLTEFAKEVPKFEFKGGLVDGVEVSAEQITEIAKLPSRDELLAKLVFLLHSPVTRFVRTLGALPRGFVTVLEQIRLKKEKEDAA